MLEPTFGASEQPANHPKESRRTHLRGPKHTIYMYLYMSINTIILGWNCCFLGPKKKERQETGNLSSSTKKGLLRILSSLGPLSLGQCHYSVYHVFFESTCSFQDVSICKSLTRKYLGSGQSLVGVRQLQNDFMKDS